MAKELSVPDLVEKHPTWFRLQHQRKWYSEKSAENKIKYYKIKVFQIIFAGLIPILTLINFPVTKYIVAILGGSIAILEGIQQLCQFHNLWIEYRSTSEHLRHEEYLFLALSGPYRDFNIEDGLLLLAERIEEHISKEHAKWVSISKEAGSEAAKNKKTIA